MSIQCKQLDGLARKTIDSHIECIQWIRSSYREGKSHGRGRDCRVGTALREDVDVINKPCSASDDENDESSNEEDDEHSTTRTSISPFRYLLQMERSSSESTSLPRPQIEFVHLEEEKS